MVVNLKRILFRIKYTTCLLFNIKQWIVLYRLKKSGKLFYLRELRQEFNGQDVFAFGTGGSISNLNNFGRLAKKNTMILTTGPLHCHIKYGFIPNM